MDSLRRRLQEILRPDRSLEQELADLCSLMGKAIQQLTPPQEQLSPHLRDALRQAHDSLKRLEQSLIVNGFEQEKDGQEYHHKMQSEP
mgnify:CR=1 FL=1